MRTESITAPVALANISQRMSRRQFNSRLCNVYQKNGSEIRVDASIEMDEDGFVEVFNSPEGILIAIHHGFAGLNFQTVDLIPLHSIVRDAIDAYFFENVAPNSDVAEIACRVADAVSGLLMREETAQ
ncbi:hypothetical protein [Mesorhizobium sp. B1-1-7]|uniref:hypothetical protein n=1 Tax=Mesorhizobium sp. B1-1-7 TaxID=2589977 RepID=UPI001128519D|nr:hypothetical protein [Mesorhizobium sp. B1-1-7]TPN53898.1 hypothetical protein FJ978_07265 [Mesorhizobium sp. B1-1-7]